MSQQLLTPSIVLGQPQSPEGCGSSQVVGSEDVERVIGGIRRELQSLLVERAALLKRIGIIKRTIAGLGDVFGAYLNQEQSPGLLVDSGGRSQKSSEPGLTDMCRQVLMQSLEPITTRQLCDRIQQATPAVLARQKQPTTSLTVVLRRLVSYGEVEDRMNEKGVRTWLWIGPRKSSEDPKNPPEAGIEKNHKETAPADITA